jgi:phosphatidylserine/phosphatidylglycerophosphate/cardiolipin synthase-like enzyme
MSKFEKHKTQKGFTMKLSRGERMCLLGFDVDAPEEDFVGFAIECKAPGATAFEPLYNRLAFSYDTAAGETVNGDRNFPSLEAPFQKFRWIHFPWEVKDGVYRYRATKMHMPKDNQLKKGTTITLDISLNPVTYHGFLDVGFTRNFASSQAFVDKLGNPKNINKVGATIIPSDPDKGLEFQKVPGDIYDWMGFEAYDLIFGFLDQALKDSKVTLDVFAYDFNEPDILKKLEAFGPRLRAIFDDSSSQDKKGNITGHVTPNSPESKAAERLRQSAGAGNVTRTHFKNLQHNKVFIARRNGIPFRVLCGSTNFTYRGLYIQANNALVFDDKDIAGLYGKYFDIAFVDTDGFTTNDLSLNWQMIKKEGKPTMHFCFSPHKSPEVSLRPLQGAIAQASSSVFYAVAFLYQMGPGITKDEFDRLMSRPIFSYGISDKSGKLELKKPDGSIGLVDFKYLADHAPEPFKSEWSGGSGINIHHKFVVTDFNLPTAKVFAGSSNLSPSGEHDNGDHLIMIEDQRVATAYAIEALRVFDHLHFRSLMQEVAKKKTVGAGANAAKDVLKLKKPKAISGAAENWFERIYKAGSQAERDRKIFSGTN